MSSRRPLLVAAAVAALLVVPTTPAEAATRCTQKGPGSSQCFTATNVVRGQKVVESVPLVNRSSKPVTAHCSFSKTISRSVSASVTVAGEVKGTLFKVVDASTSISVSASLTQTAEQATTAGGSVRLRPGQRIICQRIYSNVVSRIKEVTYYPAPRNSTTRYYSTTTPSSLGVRFVD